VAQKECPHANACLTCGFFRTNASFLSEHKQQLIRTEEILVTAREKGWPRQVEMNEKVKANLSVAEAAGVSTAWLYPGRHQGAHCPPAGPADAAGQTLAPCAGAGAAL